MDCRLRQEPRQGLEEVISIHLSVIEIDVLANPINSPRDCCRSR